MGFFLEVGCEQKAEGWSAIYQGRGGKLEREENKQLSKSDQNYHLN